MENTAKQENLGQQTEPEKTFNQSDLDRIVGERLAREREKYSDYDLLKEKAAKLDSIEEASKTELQKATERATALETELSAMKKEKEVRDIRETVAREAGIPVVLLTGSTIEECKAQAEAVKAYASPTYPVVKDHGEIQTASKGTAQEQFAAWANNFFNN